MASGPSGGQTTTEAGTGRDVRSRGTGCGYWPHELGISTTD